MAFGLVSFAPLAMEPRVFLHQSQLARPLLEQLAKRAVVFGGEQQYFVLPQHVEIHSAEQLLDRQYTFKHRNIDEKEVRLLLNQEMEQIIASIQTPSIALNEANIKTEVQGANNTTYYVEFTFEGASDEYASVIGKIYSDEFYENLIRRDFGQLFPDDD